MMYRLTAYRYNQDGVPLAKVEQVFKTKKKAKETWQEVKTDFPNYKIENVKTEKIVDKNYIDKVNDLGSL